MQKNTPELWDSIWTVDENKREENKKRYILNLKREESSKRWQRIERRVMKRFGSFQNVKVIEIGAGAGTNAALMAKRGANVTILDYSEKALQTSKSFFNDNNLRAKFVNQNALLLPDSLKNKYDISMSFGLAEHFRGKEREAIIKSHVDVLKKGGITFIAVPNKYAPFYRIYKKYLESRGKWVYGEEYPFSRNELLQISKRVKLNGREVFGGSLLTNYNPFSLLKKFFRKKNDEINKERGTFLDKYFSYCLILFGEK